MLISFGFDIALRLESPATVLFCLKLHPSRFHDLVSSEQFEVEPNIYRDEFLDSYGIGAAEFIANQERFASPIAG
jgi:hypothetical protein